MSERRKILYVFGGEQASGAEIVMERLINYNLGTAEPHFFIAPGNFSRNLIASGKPYKIVLVEQLRKLNRSSTGAVRFVIKAISNHLSVSKKVLQYTKANNIGIVHAVTVVPAAYLIPAITYSRLAGERKKWIWSQYDIKHFAKQDHWFANLCVRMFDLTLAASGAVKRLYPTAPNVKVLYNGLDTSVFRKESEARAAFRQRLDLSNGTIVFGIAGVISPRKGQLELINAFLKATQHSNNAKLLLAGQYGTDNEEYSDKVRKIVEGNNKLSYLGQRSDMVEFFNGCDVIVNNSTAALSEPLGTTIYEAMSCETVVLGSNTGGTPEIIDDGLNGFLFNPDDEKALISAVEFTISNIASLEPVRKAAREKVKQRFGHKSMIRRYNQLLGLANVSQEKLQEQVA